jgi:TfoX/Sxy family transcriptional regulator of competence genes
MAYSELTALRFRDALGQRPDIVVKRMMGGLIFMVSGHMAGGVDRDKAGTDRFMLRVGEEVAQTALELPGATQVMMGTRSTKGFIFVPETACAAAALADWVAMALGYIDTLPPK